jgi:hypothetical protein
MSQVVLTGLGCSHLIAWVALIQFESHSSSPWDPTRPRCNFANAGQVGTEMSGK